MGKWEVIRLDQVLLGSMTGEWGTDCENISGGTKVLRTTNFTNQGVIDYSNVVTRNIPESKIDKKKLVKGDIILEKSGGSDNQPVGRVVFFENDIDLFLCNNFTQILRVDQKVSFNKYVFYFLFNLHRIGITELLQNKTTGIRNLQLKRYMSTQIPHPPLPIQQKIAEALDRASALIEKRKAQIQKLDLLVKSQFVTMFGDPVTNPMGWEKSKWSDLFITTTGKLDSNEMVENGKYPFFTCAKEIFSIDRYAFDCEALLLAGNNAAAIYDVKHYKGKFNAYQRTYVITLRNDIYSYYLYKHMLEQKLEQMRELSKGTNTKYLTMGILNDFSFTVPPLPLQNQFAAFVERVEAQKARLKKSQDQMELNYKSLMQKCFAGEIF